MSVAALQMPPQHVEAEVQKLPSATQHRPSEHVWLEEHVPHEPPQPSSPQVFPAQLGTHLHVPSGWQVSG